MENRKTCQDCRKDLTLEYYRKDKKGKDGTRRVCKDCERRKRNLSGGVKSIKMIMTERGERSGIVKLCSICGVEKKDTSFSTDSSKPDLLSASCKECQSDLRLLKSKTRRDEEVNGLIKCAKCLIDKRVEDFRVNRGRVTRKCKKCMGEYEKERRVKIKSMRSLTSPSINIKDENFKLNKEAISKFFTEYKYFKNYSTNYYEVLEGDIITFLEKAVRIIPIKVAFEAELSFLNKNGVEFKISQRIDKETFINNDSVREKVPDIITRIHNNIFDGSYDESGLVYLKTSNFYLYLNPYVIMTGSSYVELPLKIKNTQACINIQNRKDNKCLLWCIIANFHRKKGSNHSKVANYNKEEYLSEYNLKNISFPVALYDIEKFEEQNNMTINVYKLYETLSSDNKIIYPITLVYPNKKREVKERHTNLLLYKGHYILIVNIQRLFSGCVYGNHTAYVCQCCGVSIYTTEMALKKHESICMHKFKVQKYLLPEEKKVKFKNYSHTIEAPFIIYSDFESYFDESDKIATKKMLFEKVHKPMGFAFKTVCRSSSKFDVEMFHYIGENADLKFTESIIEEARRIEKILDNPIRICMTPEDYIKYDNSTECFICGSQFEKENKNKIKVRDHDHITGKYRGAAHCDCNLQFTRKKYVVSVVFHNLEGYDLHLFIDSLCKYGQDFEIIPKSKEKYLALTMKIPDCKVKLKFIDSLHFFTGSLAENASKLKNHKFLKDSESELKQKQYFPYSYFTSLAKLEEECLPKDKKDWYNELKSCDISDEELRHANYIFEKFGCKTLKDYTRIYLTTDVILLAEVFEKFRDLAISTYSLDPAYYFTTPGLAWDAALKWSGVELELLKDGEMIDFFIEKGSMRGGISTVCRKKESVANNKYLDNFDHNKDSNYIMYFDVTNLYGHTMTTKLPVGDFKWVEEELLVIYENNIEQLFYSIGSYKGYMLEVDLIYPGELKDLHVELPMAAEHFKGKLSPNLFSKYNYRLRIENLKFYLDNGLKLKKIHKILEFSQVDWLASYINNNTELRKVVKDDSAKNFYKLMNNAVYGKTMENVFNRKSFKIIGKLNSDKAVKYTRSEKFKGNYIISENMVLLEMDKDDVVFDKPIYVGFSILELSKLHMYKLHYNLFKDMYGDKATLMYMDTDSLVYDIQTEDIYRDLKSKGEFFDLSSYPKEFESYSSLNKGVLGTLKDEFASVERNGKVEMNMITEFTCLRSKSYSLKTKMNKEIKKCKGVMKSELDKISYDQFQDCNRNGGIIEVCQISFRTINHKIYTVKTIKDGLSRYDDKRQIDGRVGDYLIYTVPHGYDKECDEL